MNTERNSHKAALISPPSEEGFDLLSEPDISKHKLQRRQIGPMYTASSIADLEESLDSILIKNLINMHHGSGCVVDLDSWCHMAALGKAILIARLRMLIKSQIVLPIRFFLLLPNKLLQGRMTARLRQSRRAGITPIGSAGFLFYID